MKETYPLTWPEGWPRTLLKDRDRRKGWKKTELQSIKALELHRFGAISPVITRQDPNDLRGAPDPSIAVWFSRESDEDFGWQRALGIENPSPTREDIEKAFRPIAFKYHPDNQTTGDLETYRLFDQHKKNALAYIERSSGRSHGYCIPCDNFSEARWNITAIAATLRSLRQMERDGTSRLLERAMKAFSALPENVPTREVAHVSKTSS